MTRAIAFMQSAVKREAATWTWSSRVSAASLSSAYQMSIGMMTGFWVGKKRHVQTDNFLPLLQLAKTPIPKAWLHQCYPEDCIPTDPAVATTETNPRRWRQSFLHCLRCRNLAHTVIRHGDAVEQRKVSVRLMDYTVPVQSSDWKRYEVDNQRRRCASCSATSNTELENTGNSTIVNPKKSCSQTVTTKNTRIGEFWPYYIILD